MKTVIFAAVAALLAAAPMSRADVGAVEEEYDAPVRRHIYTEREYVERVPAYREEVRVYRTVPSYVYREVPVYREVYRDMPVCREHVHFFPPAPHRVIGRVLFGY
jgi:hypothetical protein